MGDLIKLPKKPPGLRAGINREFGIAARVLGYAMVWFVLAWALFRVLVPMIWGLSFDLAPILAIAAAVGGVLALAYLLFVMVQDVLRAFSSDPQE